MAVKYHHLQSPGALFDLTLSDRSHDSAERQPAWNCRKKKCFLSAYWGSSCSNRLRMATHGKTKEMSGMRETKQKNVAHGSNFPTLWEGKTWYGTDIFSWQMYLFAMSSSHSRKLRQSVSTSVSKYQKKIRRGKGKAEREADRDGQRWPTFGHFTQQSVPLDRDQNSRPSPKIRSGVIRYLKSLKVITANPAHNPRQAAYTLLTSYTVHYDSRVNAWDRQSSQESHR